MKIMASIIVVSLMLVVNRPSLTYAQSAEMRRESQGAPQETEPLTATQMESLAAEYAGIEFESSAQGPYPTRSEAIAQLEAIAAAMPSVHSTMEDTGGVGGASGATALRDRNCRHRVGRSRSFVWQYLTLAYSDGRFTDVTDHEVELRAILIPPPQIGGSVVQDMWIRQIRTDDYPASRGRWNAVADFTIYYRLLFWTSSKPARVHCTVSP